MDLEKYDLVLFYDSINKLGLMLDEHQVAQFMEYYELLVEWNSFMNLTAITEFHEVCTKHFRDSLSLCKASRAICSNQRRTFLIPRNQFQ